MSTNNTALAMPNDNNGGSTRSMQAFIDQRGLGEWMSFDPKTEEGAKMYLSATLGELPSMLENVNTAFKVVHCYANEYDIPDDRGEIKRIMRIVLFDESGKALDCSSEGVRKSIGVLMNIRGSMPWVPPVKVTIKLKQLGNNRQWMTLDPDFATLLVTQPKRANQQTK